MDLGLFVLRTGDTIGDVYSPRCAIFELITVIYPPQPQIIRYARSDRITVVKVSCFALGVAFRDDLNDSDLRDIFSTK